MLNFTNFKRPFYLLFFNNVPFEKLWYFNQDQIDMNTFLKR